MSNRDWSYSQLRRQYGEDEALKRLATMKGYGQYGNNDATHDRIDGLTQPRKDGCIICGGSLSNHKGCWQ